MLHCKSNYTLCKSARWVKHYTMCKIAQSVKKYTQSTFLCTLWKILHLTQNFYTSCDGCDKYEVCLHISVQHKFSIT